MYVEELERAFAYSWAPVGGRENNYGIINIGSDPGYALIERVTNAIDAVIEHAAEVQAGQGNRQLPRTPLEAVELWFGIPSGRLKNVPISVRQGLADKIVVKLLDGSSARRPTVEIRDCGIGLMPNAFPLSILGLNEGNKIDKLYLAGAFGQGGSTALAFSPRGTLIASRRQPECLPSGERDCVGVTFARFRDLDPLRNKNGRYEYLVAPGGGVPAVPADQFSEFFPGTAVVHFDLEIEQYAARLTQLTGSLWALLQNALFDPVLPLWAEEHRSRHLQKGSADRRAIAGNHARLAGDARDKVEHGDSVVVTLDDPRGASSVRVHYWVIRDPEDGKRKKPIDAYVDPWRPVSYTYFGQTHGTDDQRFVSDRLGLPYLAKFLILQVELDGLAPYARRELLSATRDRLKQSYLYDEMRERISAALAEDQDLILLNDERKESILSRHSEAEREKMRERFARLMDRFDAGTDAAVAGPGGEDKGRRPKKPSPREPLEPLPTLDEPTFVRIANRQRPVPIHRNRSALLMIESDAPDGYLTAHTHARLTVGCAPEARVKLSSVSDFRGGRSRLVVRPHPDSSRGEDGTLTVFLLTPTGSTFSATVGFKIVDPSEDEPSGPAGRRQTRVPEPVPIRKDEWGNFDWSEESVAEVREEQQGVRIFVNMDNRHIRHLLDSGGYKEVGFKRMTRNYLLYVAFYAWLQHRASKTVAPGLEGEEFATYSNAELDRAAQTVIHSISAESRLDD